MTTTATRTRTTGMLPALWVGVVVSLVLGIVGMHVLNTHGLLGGASHAAMDMPSAAAAAHMSGTHDGPADAERAAGATGAAPSVVAVGDPGHGLGHTMMLCVAMIALGAGTLLLALLGLRRVPRRWVHLPTMPTALCKSFTMRLGTGPPPVWEFSIIRC
jgi:hypothetical protein